MAKSDVVMKFDADTAVFYQAVEKARQKMLQFGDSADRSGPKVDKLATTVMKFGKSLNGIDAVSLGKELFDTFDIPKTPLEALSKALTGVQAMLRRTGEEAKASADHLRTLEKETMTLIQTSANYGQMKERQAQAKAIAEKYGIENEKALRLVNTAHQADMGDSIDTFAQASSFVDAGQLMPHTKKIRNQFGEKAGSDREIMNLIGVAAAESTGLDLENLAPSVSGTSASFSNLGASLTETVAANSEAADFFKSPSIGESHLNALNNKLRQGYGGKGGFIGSWDAYKAAEEKAMPDRQELADIENKQKEISKRKLEIDQQKNALPKRSREQKTLDKERDKLELESRTFSLRAEELKARLPFDMGNDQEVNQAIRFMELKRGNIAAKDKRYISDRVARPGDWYSSKVEMAGKDALTKKLKEQRSSQAEFENVTEDDGFENIEANTALNKIKTKAKKDGEGFIQRGARSVAGEVAIEFGAGTQGVEKATTAAGVLTIPHPVVKILKDIVLGIDKQNHLQATRKGTALENNSKGQQ